jgi:hypothetical protein
MEMIGSFLIVADIAAGNIAGAAAALEEGLARPQLVIAFLAKFLHLDSITARIRKIIRTSRQGRRQ